MCVVHVFDKMLRADEISYPPAGSIEGFADGANGERVVEKGIGCWRSNARHARELCGIVDTFVHLVGKDEHSVSCAGLADGEELFCRENFSEGIVAAKFLGAVLSGM